MDASTNDYHASRLEFNQLNHWQKSVPYTRPSHITSTLVITSKAYSYPKKHCK